MNIIKIGNTLRAQIHEFSGKLSPRFSKPISRFVEQMIYGITVSQDVKAAGEALVDTLLRKIRGQKVEPYMLPTQLDVRGSSG